jgi:hypothetical protein
VSPSGSLAPVGRVLVGLTLCAVLIALAAAPGAGAGSAYCGRVSVYGHSERVYKIRGATCAKVLAAARYYASKASSLSPWMCFLGHGETYRGRRVDFACAYGGKRGNVRNWPHAFIVTR